MTPTWLNDVVTAFGRQMALTRFALNERGVAGVRGARGLALRLGCPDEALRVSMGGAAGDDPATLRHLLEAVHPAAQRGGVRLRAAYLAKRGEAVYAVRLAERGVTVAALGEVFQTLWQAADRLRRSGAGTWAVSRKA